jgi:hypothetical protein
MRLVRAPLTDTMYTQPTPVRPSWDIGCGARFSPLISISLYLFQMTICLYIMYIRISGSGVAMRLTDPPSNDTDVHPTTPFETGLEYWVWCDILSPGFQISVSISNDHLSVHHVH